MGFLILDYNTWPEPRWRDGAAPCQDDAAKVGGEAQESDSASGHPYLSGEDADWHDVEQGGADHPDDDPGTE